MKMSPLWSEKVMMYVYLASSEFFLRQNIVKIGCTSDPHGRLATYLTGCPPGLCHDIQYIELWETTATERDELFDYEEELHHQFFVYRMSSSREWFRVPDVELVNQFIASRPWARRKVEITEAPRRKCLSYQRNLSFLRSESARIAELTRVQEPVISAIVSFLSDTSRVAGYVIAPCGSGKTTMTVKGVRGVRKLVICCPSRQIQTQWRETLVAQNAFALSNICMVGQLGTTEEKEIQEVMSADVFCVISTYMSSHLLLSAGVVADDVLLICDEAHHMAGVVTEDEGRTRKLLSVAVERNLKRLFLTYTPRVVVGDAVLSMDDERVFGERIAELNLRDLMSRGVLPEYRIWSLRDETQRATGLLAKAECIAEAWSAREVSRGREQFVLRHLVVFAQTKREAKELQQFFHVSLSDTLVLLVEDGNEIPIKEFTEAPRAILVNCFVLTEGVDIPITNAVAITYPKQARGQIAQMVLRAGRWYPDKPVFHVLIPVQADEDLSGLEEVLVTLASADKQIRDEIEWMLGQSTSREPVQLSGVDMGVRPHCIVIDQFSIQPEEIRECFRRIHLSRLQEFCRERGVSTSVDYYLLRQTIPDLPENPLSPSQLWYDYLHSFRPITRQEFVETVPQEIHTADQYEQWRLRQHNRDELPSVQHITDGIFGKDYTNFNVLRREQKVKRR